MPWVVRHCDGSQSLSGGVARRPRPRILHPRASLQQVAGTKSRSLGDLPRRAPLGKARIWSRAAETPLRCTRIGRTRSRCRACGHKLFSLARVLSASQIHELARDMSRDALPPVRCCDLTSFHVHRIELPGLLRDVVRDGGQLVSRWRTACVG